MAEKNMLSQGVGGNKISLLDALYIKGSEIAVDEASTKFKFNGTFISGAVKSAGAIALEKMGKGKYGTGILASGLLMDGVADVVVAFKKRFLGSSESASVGGTMI